MNTKTTRSPIKSSVSAISKAPKKLVRIAGLEPARLAALPPQSSVSANSTISANRRKLQHATAWTQVHSGLQDFMKLLRQRPGDKFSPEFQLGLRRRYET